MEKIVNAYRSYLMKNFGRRMLTVGLVSAAIVAAIWVLNFTVMEESVPLWALIALCVVWATVFTKDFIAAFHSRPKRLSRHLYAQREPVRNKILEEFEKTEPEFGKYYLSDYMINFADGGLIRYVKIGKIEIIGKMVCLSSGNRTVLLKARRGENVKDLAAKIESCIPDEFEEEEILPDEEQLRAIENDDKILKEIVGVNYEETDENAENDEEADENAEDSEEE